MNRSTRRHATSLLKKSCLSVLVAFALTTNVNAQGPAPQAVQYAVPAGDLVQVVNEISRSSGVQIVYDIELLRGKKAAEVKGALTLEQALDRVLRGSGLSWSRVNPATVTIQKTGSFKTERKKERGDSPPKPASIQQEAEVADLEKIIVVGSRLGTSPVESALPIKVITREEIDRSGAGSISQVLVNLPEVSVNNAGDGRIGTGGGDVSGSLLNASNVQLRGLPVGTTLILINGRRAGESSAFTNGMFDLSTIPLALVERIEVLTAGASAIYGGEGLAGVINIVLRTDASGLDIKVRHMAASKYDESNASVVYGKAWSRGRMNIAATWRKTGGLSSSERSLTADQDFTRFGGQDYRFTANPGNVYSLEGCPSNGCYGLPLQDRGNLPGLDAPFARVPTGTDGRNLTPSDFISTAGSLNRKGFETLFFSPEESYALTLDGSVKLQSGAEIFTELMYSRRNVKAGELPLRISGGQNGQSQTIMSAENPFNPFGVNVGIDYIYEDTGIYREFSQTNWRALLGARGDIGRWKWELAGWKTRDLSDTGNVGYFDSYGAVAEALRSSDRSTALNPLVGDGSAPGSDELMRSFLAPINDGFGRDLLGVNTYVKGPLVNLPAGDLVVLLGAEYQKLDLTFNAAFYDPFNGNDESRAIFGEFRAPILGAGDTIKKDRLVLTGALRRESTDRFDSTAQTKTFALEAWPTESLMFRGSYSTAFKPLALWTAAQEPQGYFTYINDPEFDNALFLVENIYLGGIPAHLKPETSSSKALGLVYSPSNAYRFSLSHVELKVKDRYTSISLQDFLDNEEYLPGRVIRDPISGHVTLVDGRPVNMAETDVSVVDLVMEGNWTTGASSITASMGAAYTYRHEERLAPESPVKNNLGRWARSSWSPKWKIAPRLGWSFRDKFHANLSGRYVSAYTDPTVLSSGPNAGENVVLGAFWIVNLNLDFDARWALPKIGDYLSAARLNLGVNNLFDKQPDFCPSCENTGYDASQYDIVGRSVYAEMRLSF